MATLCVNVDHVATLREARKITEPDPVTAAGIVELAGAHGITIHLREDRRHIQERDLDLIRRQVKTKLNLEMAAIDEMVEMALKYKPDQVTLVPERRQEVTTEGGLDVSGQLERIKKTVARIQANDIPVSLFIEPTEEQITASKEVGATFIEIHTGAYANAHTEKEVKKEFERISSMAQRAHEMGLRVHAGHGLNYRNVKPVAAVSIIEDLNIGHSIISHSIFVGLERAIKEMLALIQSA